MDEIKVSTKTLEILENSIKAVGALKGHIELLARDLQALDKTVAGHAEDEEKALAIISLSAQKLLDACREMGLKLEMSPFSKLLEAQQNSDKYFASGMRDALVRIDKIQELLEKQSKVSEENVKGKWQIWAAGITMLGLLVGNIIQAIIQTPK